MDNPANTPKVMEFTTRLPVVVLCRPVQPPGVETSLRARNMDDEMLAQLVGEIVACPAITGLNLAENRNVTNDGIAYLEQLHWLTELNLSSCAVTNEGLSHLVGLSRLSRLDLSYCNRITDVGIKPLKVLRNLTYLDLKGCVKVTNGGTSKLRRPGLTIIKFK